MEQFDYSKLRGRIKEIFGTQEKFAKAVGLSDVSISAKLNNKSEWTQREINRAAIVLKIKKEEISNYFFYPKVKVN